MQLTKQGYAGHRVFLHDTYLVNGPMMHACTCGQTLVLRLLPGLASHEGMS